MHIHCDRASVHDVSCTTPFEQTGTPEPVPPGGRLPHLSGLGSSCSLLIECPTADTSL